MKRTSLLTLAFLFACAGVAVAADMEKCEKEFSAKNFKKAFKICKPLADQGVVEAENFVGIMYEQGSGVEQDMKKAAEYYKKGDDKDHALAELNLAILYRTGFGVEKDMNKAIVLYREAADHGSADAQYALGIIYIMGRGVKKDNVQAYMWLKLSGNAVPRAPETLKQLMANMSPKDIRKGEKLTRDWKNGRGRIHLD